MRVKLHYKPKPNNYTDKYGMHKRGKTCGYPGRSHGRGGVMLRTTVETRFIVKSQHQPYYKTVLWQWLPLEG